MNFPSPMTILVLSGLKATDTIGIYSERSFNSSWKSALFFKLVCACTKEEFNTDAALHAAHANTIRNMIDLTVLEQR